MADQSRTVFLSYRREVSWALAHLVRNDLTAHDFDVFMDTQNLDSGEFERVILRQIEVRTHFLVLLEPRSLDRVTDDGDWLRREIAHAISCSRNVVPVTAGSLRLPRAADLPADVARLVSFNAVSVPHDYFPEAMQKLRARFLRVPEPSPVAPGEPARAAARPVQRAAPREAGTEAVDDVAAPRLSVAVDPLGASLTWTGPSNGVFEVGRSATRQFVDAVIRTERVPRRRVIRTMLPDRSWFRVRAVDPQPTPWSNVVEVTWLTPTGAAESMTTLTVTRGARGTALRWTAVPEASRYLVEKHLGGTVRVIYRGTDLRCVDGGVQTERGAEAHYRVCAEWADGTRGPWTFTTPRP